MATSRIIDLPRTPEPPSGGLPNITELSYGLKRYDPPVQRFTSFIEMTSYQEAVEFRIRTDGEIPVRSVSPALFVGNKILVDFELTAPLSYTFFVFDPQSLPDTATIYWGWPTNPATKTTTRFRFARAGMQRF